MVTLESDGARQGTYLWDVPTQRLVEGIEQAVVADAPVAGILLDGAGDSCLAIRGDGRLAPGDLRFLKNLEGGPQAVSGLAFVANGQQVIAASADGAIRGYQVESGQGVFTAGHGVPIRALAIADDQSFATGGADGTLRLWQAGGAPFGVHSIGNLGGEVTALAWTDDRQRIVAAVAGGKPGVSIHDTTTGMLLERFTLHAQPVTHLLCLGAGGNGGQESARWVLSTAADGGWPASPARSSSSTDRGRTTDPNRRGKRSRCPILSSTMKTEVSATTRIGDRRQVVRDLVGLLLEDADPVPATEDEKISARHAGQFRRHAPRNPAALEELERCHELDLTGRVGRENP